MKIRETDVGAGNSPGQARASFLLKDNHLRPLWGQGRDGPGREESLSFFFFTFKKIVVKYT